MKRNNQTNPGKTPRPSNPSADEIPLPTTGAIAFQVSAPGWTGWKLEGTVSP